MRNLLKTASKDRFDRIGGTAGHAGATPSPSSKDDAIILSGSFSGEKNAVSLGSGLLRGTANRQR
jgi:hypothetical protein